MTRKQLAFGLILLASLFVTHVLADQCLYNSCTSCSSHLDCGWCVNKTSKVGKCMLGGPYAPPGCEASHDKWYFTTASCPGDNSGVTTAAWVVASIVLGGCCAALVLPAACIALVIYCARRRRRRSIDATIYSPEISVGGYTPQSPQRIYPHRVDGGTGAYASPPPLHNDPTFRGPAIGGDESEASGDYPPQAAGLDKRMSYFYPHNPYARGADESHRPNTQPEPVFRPLSDHLESYRSHHVSHETSETSPLLAGGGGGGDGEASEASNRMNNNSYSNLNDNNDNRMNHHGADYYATASGRPAGLQPPSAPPTDEYDADASATAAAADPSPLYARLPPPSLYQDQRNQGGADDT